MTVWCAHCGGTPQVTTYTSDLRGASTDANVYVDIKGAQVGVCVWGGGCTSNNNTWCQRQSRCTAHPRLGNSPVLAFWPIEHCLP
jgi:hypothetical protein